MGTKRSIEERRAALEKQMKAQIEVLVAQEKQQKDLDAIDVQIGDLRAKRAGLMDQIDALVAKKAEIRPPRTRSKRAALPTENPNVTVPKRRKAGKKAVV